MLYYDIRQNADEITNITKITIVLFLARSCISFSTFLSVCVCVCVFMLQYIFQLYIYLS